MPHPPVGKAVVGADAVSTLRSRNWAGRRATRGRFFGCVAKMARRSASSVRYDPASHRDSHGGPDEKVVAWKSRDPGVRRDWTGLGGRSAGQGGPDGAGLRGAGELERALY